MLAGIFVCSSHIVHAAYNSDGLLVSTNLLSGEGASRRIVSFTYNLSALPSNTTAKISFSQFGGDSSTKWFNSSGTMHGWDTLTSGTHTIDLADLHFSGSAFYYRVYFTSSDGVNTPLLDSISVAFDSNSGQYDNYNTDGTLVSTNLLTGQSVYSIDSFAYTVATLPANTTLTAQFSQNNSTWYNSSGTQDASNTLSEGSNTISLSTLAWSGANFYYRINYTSVGVRTPRLDSIDLNFTEARSISGTVYSDEGTTALGSQQVRLAVNGTDLATTTSNASTGAYSISVPSTSLASGSVVTLYLEDETADAVTATLIASADLTSVDLYKDRLITRCDNACSLTNANLTTAAVASENDVSGIYSVSGGALTLASGKHLFIPVSQTFAPGGNVSLSGNWTNNGTFTTGTETVTLAGTGTQTLKTNNAALYALTVNATGGTYTLQDALTVTNALTLTAGTLDVSTSNFGITLTGTWTNNGGTFTARSGTVTLNGGDQTINGSSGTTFYNLVKSISSTQTLTFKNDITTTITNNTTLTGSSTSARLNLRSDSSGAQFEINVGGSGTRTIQYVDVKDSHNTNATAVTCSTGCNGSGNNTGWIFPWEGTVYTNEGTTNIGSGKTVAVSINGAAAVTGTTSASGTYSILNPPVAGDVVSVYVSVGTEKAALVLITDSNNFAGQDLYQNRLIIKDDNGTNVTNTTLDTANNSGDSGLTSIYSLDGSNNLTVNSGYELFIWTGDTFAPGATVSVDDIDINGTLTLGSNAATVSGSWDATGGTVTSSGTITFTSTTTETITSNSNYFSALTFTGSGGHWNLQDALRVTGNLTIVQGSLDLNSYNLTNTGGSFSNSGTLRLQGSETLTGFTNDTDSGTTLFDGTGTYSSLAGVTSFYNLTFSGSGGTWTQAAAIDVNAALTLTAGTLDASSNSYGVTLAGGWTDTGAGAYTERSGTVTLDGTQTINANEAFNSITVNGSGITVSLGNSLDVNGNLTITTGTLDVTATNYALTVAGNWTNNATFTQRSGTVTFDGTDQIIAGSTTFYNLTKSVTTAATLTVTAGTTQTVSNVWTATGATGQLLSLRSSTNGSQWAINPQSTRTLSFIDVKDSNNTNATVILCTNDCTNSGNNSNWAFPIAITVYSNEGTTTLGANKTIAISVNGGTKTTADTNSSSIASFTTVGLSPGDVVTIWLDDETENGVTVSITNATTLGFSVYQNRLLLQHEQGSGLTTANLDTADATGDDDLAAVYSISSSNLTVADGIELFINSSDTFTPGGTVTLDDIDINGTFAMNTRNVTVSGSWDATGGTFSGSGTQTTTFDSASTETITSNANCFNNITYALATGGSITNTDALCVNGTQTVQAAGSGGGGADTTAPTISDLAVSAGETKATISWKTSESADSKVEHGTSSSLGTSSTDTSQTVWHAIQLTGLTANTTYHYKVTSKDSSNNSASSDTNTFTTLQAGTTTDTSAPTISNISASSVTSSGATVAWATSENTIGYTNYGESTSYDRGATPGTNTYTATKSVTLTGLSPSTTYHYQITAVDQAGNVGTSSDQTLTTEAEEETPEASEVFTEEETRTTADAPKLTSEAPAVTDITGRSVSISWKTDDKSTSVVYYRLRNTADNPITIGSPAYVTDHAVKVTGLDEGTEYEYSVESKDASGGILRSQRYQFTTRLPQASKTVIDNITDTTAEFVYETDSATRSVIELTNLLTGETITISEDDLVLQHRIDLNSLDPNTQYQAVILIKGPNGAVAKSLAYIFATREDKIDPIISGIETRSALIEGQRDVVQTIVIWQTDEGSTSQVLYNDGVSQDGKFRHSTDEAKDFVTKHVVVLPDLTPSTVYQYKVKSVDKADNAVESDARVLLTPQRRVSAFDLIIKNLEDTFGWTRQISQ